MKTVTINITHNDVFEDFVKTVTSDESKHITVKTNDNGVVINITGTLEELENED